MTNFSLSASIPRTITVPPSALATWAAKRPIAPGPQDRHYVTGPNPGLLDDAVNRARERLAHGADAEVDRIGERMDDLLTNDAVLRENAVDRRSRGRASPGKDYNSRCGKTGIYRRPAPRFPTSPGPPGLNSVTPGPTAADDPAVFMPQNDRGIRLEGIVIDMDIGSADPRGLYFDHYLAGPRRRPPERLESRSCRHRAWFSSKLSFHPILRLFRRSRR